ncbi:MAG: hypothetical protein ACLQPV_10505 [Vulcanimicrobiaceae bacterium]
MTFRLAVLVFSTAVLMAAAPAVRLAIAPWHGANLPTADAGSMRYRLIVSGAPRSTVYLVAENVTPGWLAAFCTDRVCSPQRVTATLPDGGSVILQFELIREQAGGSTTGSARVAGGGASVSVP